MFRAILRSVFYTIVINGILYLFFRVTNRARRYR